MAFPWSRGRPQVESAPPVIRGKKVVLREKRLEDAVDDYSWRVDDELCRLDATTRLRMSYNEYLRYAREEMGFSGQWSMRFAIDTLDGKHIGNCMYYDIDLRRREAELGIMIGDRDYWGDGYGTDAVETLLRYVFAQGTLDRIYLHTLDWNQRARGSFAKAGLREVKSVRRSGMNFVLMEVQRAAWEARPESADDAEAPVGEPNQGIFEEPRAADAR